MILPFSYVWIMRRELQHSRSILDVGCGDGDLMKRVNYDKKYQVVGIDLYMPSVAMAKKTKVYSDVMIGDIRKLRIKAKSYDVVFSSQVVEHLDKKEALALIKEMEKIAKKKVVIGTTNGFFPFHQIEGVDENPLQVHKSGWEVQEMRNKGYKVYGQGTGFIYKPWGVAHKIKLLNPFWFALSYALSPIQYFFPRISAYIIAVKKV